VRALRTFAGYLARHPGGHRSRRPVARRFAMTVLGVLSGSVGEPRGWWIPVGLVLLVVSFLPVYSLFRHVSGSA